QEDPGPTRAQRVPVRRNQRLLACGTSAACCAAGTCDQGRNLRRGQDGMRPDHGTRREVEYDLEQGQERALCDAEPTLLVTARRRVVTTTHHADGSVTTTETPWEFVKSWTYKHKGESK